MIDQGKLTPALLVKIAKRGLELRARRYAAKWAAEQRRRLDKTPGSA